VLESECIAKVEEGSLPYRRLDPLEKKEALRIRQGDLATTGFFRVSRIDLRAKKGRVQSRDENGIPNKVIPHVLDLTLEVSTIAFNPRTEHITVKNVNTVTQGRIKPKKRTPRRRRTGGRRAGPGF